MRFTYSLFILILAALTLSPAGLSATTSGDEDSLEGVLTEDGDVTLDLDAATPSLTLPDFKGNRSPAIEGPATDEPQGDQASLYY